MKNMTKFISALAIAILCMASCTQKEQLEQPLEVNYNNIAGIWQLDSWNGSALAEGSYMWIVIERRDHRFTIYQKIDSMYGRAITGVYTITEDPYKGSVVSGEYDFGAGAWNREYVVTDLMPSGTMIWTAVGDDENSDDVSLFRKCTSVPEDIIRECSNEETRLSLYTL